MVRMQIPMVYSLRIQSALDLFSASMFTKPNRARGRGRRSFNGKRDLQKSGCCHCQPGQLEG